MRNGTRKVQLQLLQHPVCILRRNRGLSDRLCQKRGYKHIQRHSGYDQGYHGLSKRQSLGNHLLKWIADTLMRIS